MCWCFGETPNSGSGYLSEPFAYTWNTFPLLGMLCPSLYQSFYLVLFCYAYLFFLKRNQGVADLAKKSDVYGSQEEWREGNYE